MSGYRTHFVIYGASALGLTYLLFRTGYISGVNPELVLAFILGLLYSILPDIDTPASKTREYVSKLLLASVMLCLLSYTFVEPNLKLLYLSFAIAVFLYLLWFTKHRGIFHTIYAGLFLSLPLYLISPIYALYAFTGFASHLLADGKLF
ncbi:MAG: metal-dependent hydrolase [Candidatus Altiarchaeota archaeon]|nr:metal-dependent hydrolase [Candidatus Altiarchaeota archaeon]